MVTTLEIAIIGLFLLIPVEIIFLLIIYALSKETIPKGPHIPPKKRKQRYEWESYIRMKERKKPAQKRSYGKLFGVVLFVLLALLILTGLFFATGPLMRLASTYANSTNVSLDALPSIPNIALPKIGVPTLPSFSSNLTNETIDIELPLQNITPTNTSLELFNNHTFELSASLGNVSAAPSFYTDYTVYIWVVAISVLLIILALAAFMFMVKHKNGKLLRQAAKIADAMEPKEQGHSTRLWIGGFLILFGVISLAMMFRSSISTLIPFPIFVGTILLLVGMALVAFHLYRNERK